jgi:fumarate hydratase subunit beta
MAVSIHTPLSEKDMLALHAGDIVELSGHIYTGRDAAHKKLHQLLADGGQLPFDLNGQTIYYVGPCPAAPGEVIGPCGPTTSGRVDPYTPELIAGGLRAMIGKGMRSQKVIDAMRGKAVYFAATGGAAALLASFVKKSEVAAFPELMSEAIYKLTVEKFPVVVAIDAYGRNLYEEGPAAYRR